MAAISIEGYLLWWSLSWRDDCEIWEVCKEEDSFEDYLYSSTGDLIETLEELDSLKVLPCWSVMGVTFYCEANWEVLFEILAVMRSFLTEMLLLSRILSPTFDKLFSSVWDTETELSSLVRSSP